MNQVRVVDISGSRLHCELIKFFMRNKGRAFTTKEIATALIETHRTAPDDHEVEPFRKRLYRYLRTMHTHGLIERIERKTVWKTTELLYRLKLNI